MPSPRPLPRSASLLGPKKRMAITSNIKSSGTPSFPPNIVLSPGWELFTGSDELGVTGKDCRRIKDQSQKNTRAQGYSIRQRKNTTSLYLSYVYKYRTRRISRCRCD